MTTINTAAQTAAAKTASTTKTTVFGRVSGIEAGNGVTTLMMGKVPVKMEDVITAQLPTAA